MYYKCLTNETWPLHAARRRPGRWRLQASGDQAGSTSPYWCTAHRPRPRPAVLFPTTQPEPGGTNWKIGGLIQPSLHLSNPTNSEATLTWVMSVGRRSGEGGGEDGPGLDRGVVGGNKERSSLGNSSDDLSLGTSSWGLSKMYDCVWLCRTSVSRLNDYNCINHRAHWSAELW